MNNNCLRIPTTAQLRALEAAWIKACHPQWGMVLMEQAGMAAAQIARALCDNAGSAVIFCGRGNNGGDGLVVARHLQRLNVPVSVYMVASSDSAKQGKEQSESAVNKHIFESALGLSIHELSMDNLDSAREALFTSDVIIDALLGTGLDRNVEGIYLELIKLINDSQLPVLSIDLPSGINSDTGKIMGIAVEADATVTFGHLKAGLLHHPGAEHAGAISVIDIGVPALDNLQPALTPIKETLASPLWWLVTAQAVIDTLPYRPQASNKGSFGKLLCIAGSAGMPGSALLASRAALRCGTGIVVLASVWTAISSLPAEEIIYHGLIPTAEGSIPYKALNELKEQIAAADAVLLGPGLTTHHETSKLVEELIAFIDKPCIIDADALNIIAQAQDQKRTVKFGAPEKFVITPHPKEMSRLLGSTVAEVQNDRFAAAQAAVRKFGCNVILKGSNSVIGTHDGQSFVVTTGNSGMATAGAGDVLSGMVGAFLAQSVEPAKAAIAATYLHGAAGDIAAAEMGEDGLIAGDLVKTAAAAIAKMRNASFTGTYLEDEARW